MSLPLIELGGPSDAPVLHIAPANGFVPQTYLPLLRPFMDFYRVIALPPRALWEKSVPPMPEAHDDWTALADDLLAGIAAHGLANMIAIGHSFSGVASMLAALRQPEHFRALVMLDPTILSQDILKRLRQAREMGMADQHPLAQRALRRRSRFASAEAAYEYFRSKRLFRDWPDEALRLYAEYGTRISVDGKGVELMWSAAWEAYYFSTVYLESWDMLPRLEGLLPVLIVSGGDSDTFVPDSVTRAQRLLPSASYRTIEGHGHLFPQTAPHQTATVIAEWLATLP